MIRGVILFATVTLVAALSFGATIHVPSQQPTIQTGINAASNGDTVLVAPGTYQEYIVIITSGLTLISSGGREVTTIRGLGGVPIINYPRLDDTSLQIVKGFGLKDNTGGSGCAVSARSGAHVIDS